MPLKEYVGPTASALTKAARSLPARACRNSAMAASKILTAKIAETRT